MRKNPLSQSAFFGPHVFFSLGRLPETGVTLCMAKKYKSEAAINCKFSLNRSCIIPCRIIPHTRANRGFLGTFFENFALLFPEYEMRVCLSP